MLSLLPGYQISVLVYESTTSFIYQGYREQDDRPVVLKVLKPDYCNSTELERYQREYSITRRLDFEGIIQAYALEKYQNTLVMVLEDFGGKSLKSLMKEREFTLSEFLTIAIHIAEILGQVHSAGVIHKDINPSNILFVPESGQVKLIDFGISTGMSHDRMPIQNAQGLEGTLAYMSPEQTGRTNREIDYRADFYSLGVTFYELLTGTLPFQSKDVMELVHAHLAIAPIPPHEIRPELPQAVSEIVMKMLQKTPEDRYQSAWGIQADLVLCLMQLEATGLIEDLVPGENDVTQNFHIPAGLYGREREVETLLAVFDRVASPQKNQVASPAANSAPSRSDRSAVSLSPSSSKTARPSTEFILISGYSGMGKSALVASIHRPIGQKEGYFISGKFDRLQENIPYSAAISAFGDFVRQLLTHTEAQLSQWRGKLAEALGEQGQVIIDVIPELQLIIGEHPPLTPLEPEAERERFAEVFQKFVRVFCISPHPIVLFLDDLQWADDATLDLIEQLLIDEEIQYLLLVGACRSNEVGSAHPLMVLLDRLHDRACTVEQLELEPLELEPIVQLIADTLHSDERTVKPLAALVKYKTNGNPFFIREFLKTLYAEKLLVFDEESIGWQWDITQIEAMGMTDNVVGLTIAKLKTLPESTQQLLSLAACMGKDFDLHIIAAISQKSVSQTFHNLIPALVEGLVQPTSETSSSLANSHDSSVLIAQYKFLHDRVQRAANARLDGVTKQKIRFQIGKTLLERVREDRRSEMLYPIVDHWNASFKTIENKKDKVELVALNLEAARKAKDEMKYDLALDYLKAGIQSSPEEIWLSERSLAFAIHKERAKVEYLNGNLERSKILVQYLLNQATSPIEKAEFKNILIAQYTLETQYERAIETGLETLKSLGFNLPNSNLDSLLERDVENLESQMAQGDIARLKELPEISRIDIAIIIKLLRNLASPIFLKNKKLFGIINLKIIELSLKYGQAPESSTAYASYGILQNILFENPVRGFKFATLGVEVSDRAMAPAHKCETSMKLGAYLMPWVKPLRNSLNVFETGYRAGINSGALQFSGYTLVYKLLTLFYAGTNLGYILSEIPNFLTLCQKTQNIWAIDTISGLRFPLLNLCAQTQNYLEFQSEDMEESEYLANCEAHQTVISVCLHHLYKLQIFYLYGNYSSALDSAIAARENLATIESTMSIAEYQFFYGLTLAALYPSANSNLQKQYWQTLEAIQNQLERWTSHCPENFEHKCLLLSAEMAWISDAILEAVDLYDFAIASAKENEFIQHEALANERATKFWLARGKEKIASLYLNEAYRGYQRWGASRKVEELESKYAYLLTPSPIHSNFPDSLTLNGKFKSSMTVTFNSTRTRAGSLDLVAVTKAAQVLSGEIVLTQLLDKLMHTIVANAGATTGFLMLERDDRLTIEAIKSVGSDTIALQESIPANQIDRLPLSVINYVARTHENVVSSDPATESAFATDPYIQLHQPKSILCAPIQGQGKLIGLVYLENNITSGAFTDERLDVLMLLCAQAAIALENTRLYHDLQQSEMRERERGSQLKQSLKDLQEAQLKLVQGEKMATLGQLVAGIAHEINNPVGFIAANISHAQGYIEDLKSLLELYQDFYPDPVPEIVDEIDSIDLDFIIEDLPKIIGSMQVGTDRIRQISKSLRTFCRSDTSAKVLVDIHEGIDSTLMILKHRLKANDRRPEIDIIREYGQLPSVNCYAGQLNQVFMNILANAIDAFDEFNQNRTYTEIKQNPNQIKIKTELNDIGDRAVVRIEDNGNGMPEEVQQKVFEHLFTTKPVGKGTGLGLSISRQIVVEKHRGQLSCYSVPGEGTQFAIEIPLS
ncbi:AAA family ATPase [Oscillatoriales cyanobacterium LEGE 11467]|uniref:histidine kinase n=1 Tax=Zarconia navalis LEGE 11467 TaxID=1828826 RepID=A0A928VXC1_9CYAN|nr:ATP-binding sensor histidine kinase [Zarconia navalis]MBE9040472.1 AAA family ATPase [Zarconia navalis LEGE 11467]